VEVGSISGVRSVGTKEADGDERAFGCSSVIVAKSVLSGLSDSTCSFAFVVAALSHRGFEGEVCCVKLSAVSVSQMQAIRGPEVERGQRGGGD
jgi:hypothetical protein